MKNWFVVICLVCWTFGLAQYKSIELPLSSHNGYGPFELGFSSISVYSDDPDDPFYLTYRELKGIPKDWKDVKKGSIETNGIQHIYQHFLAGRISTGYFEASKRKLNWSPEAFFLSEKEFKSTIAVVYTKDISGKIKMIVDANNNQDFSDDRIFSPPTIETFSGLNNNDSLLLKNSISVNYERELNNTISKESVPLSIIHVSSDDILLYNFPRYLTTSIEDETIAICSNGFMDLSNRDPRIVAMNNDNNQDFIATNEFIRIKNNIYINKGLNLNKNVLMLEQVDLPFDQLYSTQIGFKSLPFQGQNYLTKAEISSDDYKGKYLLIVFWATWCKPCIEELATLKKLYAKADKSRFELIGIVGESTADEVNDRIIKSEIDWPLILSDDKNKIAKRFGIIGYPTSFLVDPDGIIIEKNLRGKKLESRINELN